MEKVEENLWQWRGELRESISAVTRGLKERYSSAQYAPDRYGSPWQSVKLADEVANDIVSEALGGDRAEFRAAVRAALEQSKERFYANDAADPDGYVCGTLGEYLAAMDEVDSV